VNGLAGGDGAASGQDRIHQGPTRRFRPAQLRVTYTVIIGEVLSPSVRKVCPVSYVSWDRDRPEQGVEPEHLLEVVEVAEGPAVLVAGLVVEHGTTKLLQSRSVVKNQVDVVPEQRGDADAEEDGDQEDEDHVVLGHPNTEGVRPELGKVPGGGGGDEGTVGQRVTQEEHEKFIVSESNTVVDPGTVVVHLEGAGLAHRAVVRSVWLYALALFTISHCTLNTSLFDPAAHFGGNGGQARLPLLLRLRGRQGRHGTSGQHPRRGNFTWWR